MSSWFMRAIQYQLIVTGRKEEVRRKRARSSSKKVILRKETAGFLCKKSAERIVNASGGESVKNEKDVAREIFLRGGSSSRK